MEKNDFAGIFIYLVMLVLAFVVGQTVISIAQKEVVEYLSSMSFLGYVVICIAASSLLYTIIYELGHIIGAHIGGYSVTLVNIFFLCWYKDQGKAKFGFRVFDGLLSEFKCAPKENKKGKPFCFLFGGILLYIVSAAISVIVAALVSYPPIRWACLIYLGISLILLLYHIMPMQLDTINDGYRIKLLLGNRKNVAAFNEFMRVEETLSRGLVPTNIQLYEDISPMTILVNQYALYEVYQAGDEEKAESIVEMYLANKEKISSQLYLRFLAKKMRYLLMFRPLEEAKEFYWKQLSTQERKFMENDNHLDTQLAYFLISGLINESVSECRIALSHYQPLMKKCKYVVQKEVEEKQYIEAKQKVLEVLKDADFDEFL